MYRRDKLFHSSGTGMFVWFLFVIYIATTMLLSPVEGSETIHSQWKIKESQRIVGRFLRDKAGTNWLSELAKTHAAPLTTSDLMKAILQATKQGGRVWQAATVLAEALAYQGVDGKGQGGELLQFDSWKDLISNIEMENDIICLYRKNTNETTQKGEDWEKFLKTVSPGYTVHIAIDTGRTYVICLKKMEVPKPAVKEHTTVKEEPTTVTTTLSTPAVPRVTMPPLKNKLKVAKKLFFNERIPDMTKARFSDDECDDKYDKQDYTDYEDDNNSEEDNDVFSEIHDEEEKYIYDYGDSVEKEFKKNKIMHNNFVNPGKNQVFRQEKRLLENGPWQIPYYNNLKPIIETGPVIVPTCECKKPVVLVVPNGNGVSPYQPPLSAALPIQRLEKLRPPWASRNPYVTPPYDSYNVPNARPKFSGPIKIQKEPIIYRRPSNLASHYNQRLPKFLNDPTQIRNVPLSRLPKLKYPVENKPKKKSSNVRSNSNRNMPQVTKKLSDQSIRDTITYRPFEFDKRPIPTINIIIPKSRFPNQYYQMNRKPMLQQPIKRPVEYYRHPLHDESHVERFPIVNQVFPVQYPYFIKQKFCRIDPRTVGIFKLDQRPVQLPHIQLRPLTNYPEKSSNFNVQPQLIHPRTMVFKGYRKNFYQRFSPSWVMESLANSPSISNRPMNHAPCINPCDRPIKLQIFINGKLQEPLNVAAFSESGQKLAIVGSAYLPMNYQSRVLTNGLSVNNEEHNANNDATPEIGLRMDQRDKENIKLSSNENTSGTNVKTEGDKLSIKKNEMKETVTSGSRNLSNKNITTIQPSSINVEKNKTISTTVSTIV